MSELYTQERLKELQELSLDEKIEITQDRIEDWYMQFSGNVYVSFSGGKDSTVLLHIVRQMFPEVPAIFFDTGLEYPELRRFVNETKNVRFIRPKMTFPEVIKQYGYPIVSKEVAEAIHYARRRNNSMNGMHKSFTVEGKDTGGVYRRSQLTGDEKINALNNNVRGGVESRRRIYELTGNSVYTRKPSRFNKEKWFKLAVYAPFRISHYCCNVMKKQPAARYHSESKRVPYIGTMTEESQLRKQAWLRHGCNAFHSKKQTSSPLSFWTEQDILQYIQRFNLKIAPVYGDIIPAKKDGQMMMEMGGNTLYTTTGCMRTGCVFCGFGAHLEKGETRFQMLKKTHPQLYQYCIDGGEWIENPDYDPSLSNEPDEIGWIDWNPPKLWIPNKNGLGMGKVFDIGNELYEKEMWRY